MSSGAAISASLQTRQVRLDARALYVTPTGRWCRWCPGRGALASADGELFLYHLANGLPAPRVPRSDGFFLSAKNLRLLRRMDR